jgi:hypothetical protein
MAEHSPSRAATTQVRLRVAVNAGEVTFDRHGVVGAAIDETFRMVTAPPLKDTFARSPDAVGLIVSDWFYHDVVLHHQDARPESYQHVETRMKQAPMSAWIRVPVSTLWRKDAQDSGRAIQAPSEVEQFEPQRITG